MNHLYKKIPALSKANQRIKAKEKVFLLGWNNASIKEYFTQYPPAVGEQLIVFDASGGLNQYHLVTVIDSSYGKRNLIKIMGHSNGYSSELYYRSGKNAHNGYQASTKVCLLPYHERVAQQIELKGGIKTYTEAEIQRLL
ncbi:hypothetical protein [Vibrio lentus]|uniref:Uncharacterized protein n=1 Tax=Vibrio lentus TaxID=136468 RepID=A0A4U2EX11_9VIBR|nr:hypothetical protein [Vibrio lentus]PML09896.1 hypothetical protein BCT85_13530 [Vibrio lentus]TKG07701.1 hypothetical protein FCV91_13885 [Vibrio lentus]